MTLKVVQGLVGASSGRPQTVNPSQTDSKSVAQQSVQASSSVQVASSEAVVANVRSVNSKLVGSTEKIRNVEVAQKLAEKVADKIGHLDEAGEVHSGLDRVSGKSAKEYLV